MLHVPVTPFSEVEGRAGALLPEQIFNAVPKLNVGVKIGLTVTLNVGEVIHSPGIVTGVNVYTPEARLSITEGLHAPVTPLSDVLGSVGTVAPAHIVSVVPKLNVGIVFGVTVTVKFVVVAHCPAEGVKVYTPEACLSTIEGNHVPFTALSDVAGNVGTFPSAQIVREVPKLNVGVIIG